MSKKLSKLYTQKLFLKSKYILKTTFFYVKEYVLAAEERKIKNIIVVSKKCGNAVKRNYIRRITKVLFLQYTDIFNPMNIYILVYEKKKLNELNYNDLKKSLF